MTVSYETETYIYILRHKEKAIFMWAEDLKFAKIFVMSETGM
jgi:hypothetical protein